MGSEDAFAKLKEGNQRFIDNKLEHPNRCAESKQRSAVSQEPFAIILGCADSRVSAEIIFDQGIGDLFVVRVAGNVLGPLELESIGFAVENFHCSLIVVLGHEKCGAIHAFREEKISGIETIASHIPESVRKATSNEAGVKVNVDHVVDQLQAHFPRTKIQGGYYHLDTGKVEFMPVAS